MIEQCIVTIDGGGTWVASRLQALVNGGFELHIRFRFESCCKGGTTLDVRWDSGAVYIMFAS